MIKLDDDLLKELGLSALPLEEKKKLLAHIYETLEMRVGMKLAEQMTDAQLAEFEQFIDSNNEAGALQWLETNFPNYKDVVASEFDRLKAEILQVAPQIVASALAQAPLPVTDHTGALQQPMQATVAPQPYAPPSGQQPVYPPQSQAQYGPPPQMPPQQPS